MPKAKELLELLLTNRGIKPEDFERFLHPSYEDHIYDPYLMKDMEKVCVRIFEATEAKEKIVIYTDYDCDGIPAAVIMNDFFKKIGYENYTIYIPDRHDEGYGLHIDAIDQFITDGVNLLITFDLGITAVAETALAQGAGIDVIITDHHLPHESVPNAYAIINPKQIGCKYPDKMLCGAGLAFKIVQALCQKYGEYWNITKGWEKWLLDMAGVATLSDQVPLVDENRVLAYYGLKVLQKNHRVGLQQFWKKAGVDATKLIEDDVTFSLAPKINAASRMDSPMRAFELLATTEIAEAGALTDHLMKINENRKVIVAHIMKEVKVTLSKREEKSVIVIGNPKWRVGVLGIVASKIVDEYKKPAFVWGMEGGDVIKGSCRVYGNINLVEVMQKMPENSLLEFGGHAQAGGFAVHHDEIHFLEEKLVAVVDNLDKSEILANDTMIDAVISIDDVNNENYKIIEQLAPFGAGNPKPTFMFENIQVAGVKEFGKEKNHLELSFLSTNKKIIKAIAFFKTRTSFSARQDLAVGMKIDLIAVFEKSTFAGRTELRLRIIDII
ncbi:MAG: single-stranded-DNA-specific exonuclease [Patescibacteria group bacterium]|nr:single-stranded-DNA-specific exonuclease [Patescibacteria group bacterium]